jgi:hypothetical protein
VIDIDSKRTWGEGSGGDTGGEGGSSWVDKDNFGVVVVVV